MRQDETDTLACARQRSYEAFKGIGRARHYRRGAIVFEQGEVPAECFVVESGRVTIGHVAPTGREIIHFIHHARAVFGFAEILLRCERRRSAYAVDETDLWVVSRAQLVSLMSECPGLTDDLLTVYADRLLSTQAIVEQLVAESASARLIRFLWRLARELGPHSSGAVPLPIRLTHEELARCIGCTRQTVTTVLDDLQSRGIIQVSPRAIRILDWSRLSDGIDANL